MLFLKKHLLLVKKSSIQTAIDLHMEEVDRTTEVEISYFDDWVHFHTVQHVTIFKNKGTYAKVPKKEKMVFSITKKKSIIEAVNQLNYILLKAKNKKHH